VRAVFVGTYYPRLDDKGRLTLPAKFREGLAGGVVVTKGPDRTLTVLTRDEFADRAVRAVQASRASEPGRAYLRNFTAGADEQVPDGQGRVTLTAAHRRYAGLTKECVVVGAYNWIEIWNLPAWQDFELTSEPAYSEANEPTAVTT